MVVLKFGGTSVRDAEWIDKAIAITGKELGRAPVLVASAMGKTTDRLQEIAHLAGGGEREKAVEILKTIKASHLEVARKFITGGNLSECTESLEHLFKELGSLIKGISLLRDWTPRSNDAILAFGELFSTIIIAHRAGELGIETFFIDSREIIKTDSTFSNAQPIKELTNSLIRDRIKPSSGKLYIAQGFIASTKSGITTTLGRGGSDYTAAIIGAALGAEEIQIWTDVNGIMTSDPRIVGKATTIPRISYKEAAELAYFGAKVIHPSTIQPATSLGIPVTVRNTGNPGGESTWIVAEVPSEGPKALACKKGITVINITSYRMLLAYGFLRRIFEIFEKYKTSVDLVATSEVSVSLTIDNTGHIDEITRELENIGNITIEGDKSIVCLVGLGLWKNPQIISRVFSSLTEIPVRMISLGSSDTNLSFVVPDKEVDNALKGLHRIFFE
ncbi:MAG: aspartate kinase [Spirochaetales bacterium]|nr:aspartate kinase [Spirochaetales bacterium]